MKALYYLSQSIGRKRKDGSPFYVMNVLGIDRFGTLAGVPVFFPSADSYNDVLSKNIQPGTPIHIATTWQGAFTGEVEVDTSFNPLRFDEKPQGNSNK